MKTESAVEWLCEQYHLKQDIEIVKQAKEMEKRQIIDAYDEGLSNWDNPSNYLGKEYYKETFKK